MAEQTASMAGAPRRGASAVGCIVSALPMLWDHYSDARCGAFARGMDCPRGAVRTEFGATRFAARSHRRTLRRQPQASRGRVFYASFRLFRGPDDCPYLGLGRNLRYHDYALRFASSTALEALCIHDAEAIDAGGEPFAARHSLLEGLVAHTEPVLEALYRHARVPRRVLWSMATSTWAARFVEVGERLGDAALGWREAEATFELLPKICRAAPQLYGVGSGERQGVCQVRRACCLATKPRLGNTACSVR
jgi:hypothetical protein